MKRILYIQVGSGFLHVNKRVIAELQKHFPACEIELFDLMPILKRDFPTLFMNGVSETFEYFGDFISGKKSLLKFKYHFLGTSYLFRYFTRKVVEKTKEKHYDLIFQTQCLCDASATGLSSYIYTDHTNLNNLRYRWTAPRKYLRSREYLKLERAAYQKSTGIFVMSENIRNSLITQYNVSPEKITLAYVGSNTTMPTDHSSEKYHNKNIIFVGKDWERKGGPVLIAAFEKVLQRIPDATLTILGCSPRVTTPNCRVFGEVDLEEVAEQYRHASVFCFPTLREPFGIVYIEAMFNKLPIVTNNMGAAASLITTKNGFLLEPDPDAYADVLIKLLNNPELCRSMGEESFRIASSFYTWPHVGEVMAAKIKASITSSRVTTENSIV